MGGEEDGNSSRMHEQLLLVGSEDKSNFAEDYRVMDTQEARAGCTQVGRSSQSGAATHLAHLETPRYGPNLSTSGWGELR